MVVVGANTSNTSEVQGCGSWGTSVDGVRGGWMRDDGMDMQLLLVYGDRCYGVNRHYL